MTIPNDSPLLVAGKHPHSHKRSVFGKLHAWEISSANLQTSPKEIYFENIRTNNLVVVEGTVREAQGTSAMAAMSRRSSRGYTAPVGLLGLTSTRARVRAVMRPGRSDDLPPRTPLGDRPPTPRRDGRVGNGNRNAKNKTMTMNSENKTQQIVTHDNSQHTPRCVRKGGGERVPGRQTPRMKWRGRRGWGIGGKNEKSRHNKQHGFKQSGFPVQTLRRLSGGWDRRGQGKMANTTTERRASKSCFYNYLAQKLKY